ncbi:MAG: nitronate monooxygenase, partial [Kiritimatiellae bacterium]|nr:nitronate monooxygenase [Kiritimatiellia bacterium]
MIIQGGMGAGVSNWTLTRAVSRLGQLGVVAGTALDQILTRRLQDGDPGGMVQQALEHFPFPKIARRILDDYFLPEGRAPGAPYKAVRVHTVNNSPYSQQLCVAANFVEIFLAKLGHDNPVGINYLEKIQLPHLPSLYGAMLAGVAVVIVGAGIPFEFAAAMDALAEHGPARYTLSVSGAPSGEKVSLTFDPASCGEPMQPLDALERPAFLPIISSDTLAVMLCRRLPGGFQGFVIEGATAGGHNAPPRGQLKLTEDGQPIYGDRDCVNLETIRKLGVPFWLAGSY